MKPPKHSLKSVTFATFAIAGLSAIAAPAAQAATVLTGFSTTGANMGGMEITLGLLDGTYETAIWQPTSSVGGGAFGSTWRLTQSGNTFNGFNNAWSFNYGGVTPVTSLTIDAIPGNTVFDITDAIGLPGSTPGSANGGYFEFVSGRFPTTANYSVPIDISVGDLFGRLTLTWAGGFTPGSVAFLADTDSGTSTNPVTPVTPPPPVVPPPPVPDPDPPVPDPPAPDPDPPVPDPPAPDPEPPVPVPDPPMPDPPAPDPPAPDPVSVPEPGLLLGLFGLGALGVQSRYRKS